MSDAGEINVVVEKKIAELFHHGLSKQFPKQINIDVTEFCNLACIHCPYETVSKKKKGVRHHLDRALHSKMLNDIVENGFASCSFLRYTGDGEPLMHPKLDQLIEDASSQTGLPINLTTNGILLTEEQGNRLLDAGVSVFDISIDAARPMTYEAVRRKGKLEIIHKNVRALIALKNRKNSNARVVVSFVKQAANAGEAEEFRIFWEREGIDFVVIRDMHSCSGEIKEVAQQMRQNAPAPRTPCRYPWERLIVKPDGKIVYCPADWLHMGVVGHLSKNSVSEVWNGAPMQALREAHVQNDYSNHPFCSQCPDWQVIPWPEEGRDYATMMDALTKKING
jgi:radical SAM protein with 4Fe4S-binding SPASM domain